MVINDSIQNDGFSELLKTQIHDDIPLHLERAIMQKIEQAPAQHSSSINISAIFIFSLLAFLYVLLAVLATYVYPNVKELSDFKLLIGLGIMIHIMYEANETFPKLLNHWIGKKIA